MQTPDSSPQQRKRSSPISTLSRKSWFNLRSKLGSKGHSPPSAKPEFLLLSANVSPRKPSVPKVDFELIATEPILNQSEQVNDASPTGLGEPFDDGSINDDGSDTKSQFSFGRSSSCHYYKHPLPPSGNTFLHPDRYYGNASLRSSFSSYSDMSISDISSVDDDFNLYNTLDDGERDYEDEADPYADLIAEANMVTDEEDLADSLFRQRSSTSSMHRQLSQVTRDDLVITFFEETQPKRTRSTISSKSTVWPIQE